MPRNSDRNPPDLSVGRFNFKTWLQRAKIHTWLLGNSDVMEALKKAYEAGERNGRKQAQPTSETHSALDTP